MVTVRPYVPDDYGSVREILEPEGMYDAVWDSPENLNAMCLHPPGGVLVAETGGEVVGCLYLIPWGVTVMHFYRFAVLPQYRQSGVGSAILEYAGKILQTGGYLEIGLFADSGNPTIIGFYRKRGFTALEKAYSLMWKPIRSEPKRINP